MEINCGFAIVICIRIYLIDLDFQMSIKVLESWAGLVRRLEGLVLCVFFYAEVFL